MVSQVFPLFAAFRAALASLYSRSCSFIADRGTLIIFSVNDLNLSIGPEGSSPSAHSLPASLSFGPLFSRGDMGGSISRKLIPSEAAAENLRQDRQEASAIVRVPFVKAEGLFIQIAP